MQTNVWRSFSNWSVIISQKCMVTPYFLFGYQCYKDLLSTDSFKPRKNITVFESFTDRKNVCAITNVGTALKL